jgi:hypothetical protein
VKQHEITSLLLACQLNKLEGMKKRAQQREETAHKPSKPKGTQGTEPVPLGSPQEDAAQQSLPPDLVNMSFSP